MPMTVPALLPSPPPPDPRRLSLLRFPAVSLGGPALLAGALERLESDADPWLRAALKRERGLGSRPRRLVSDAINEVFRKHKLLQILLRAGGWDGARAPEALWLAALIRIAGLDPAEAGERFGAQVFAAAARPGEATRRWLEEERPAPALALATLASCPEWFAGRLLEERGERAWALAAALAERAPVSLRVNAARADRETARARLAAEGAEAAPGRWSELALVSQAPLNLAGSSAWREGLFELQDEGSQLIAELVAPRRGGLVVDLCAGAGGKSLAIAARLPRGTSGPALDVGGGAREEAARRARRAGVALRTTRIDPEGPLPIAPGAADRVLVDAPCSGSGVIRRHPASRWRLTADQVAPLPALQGQLLDRAAPLVRPGGRLIYATCSLLRCENQAVADAFLERHPGWRAVSVAELLGRARALPLSDGGDLSLDPEAHDTDGFYARAFQAPAGAA